MLFFKVIPVDLNVGYLSHHFCQSSNVCEKPSCDMSFRIASATSTVELNQRPSKLGKESNRSVQGQLHGGWGIYVMLMLDICDTWAHVVMMDHQHVDVESSQAHAQCTVLTDVQVVIHNCAVWVLHIWYAQYVTEDHQHYTAILPHNYTSSVDVWPPWFQRHLWGGGPIVLTPLHDAQQTSAQWHTHTPSTDVLAHNITITAPSLLSALFIIGKRLRRFWRTCHVMVSHTCLRTGRNNGTSAFKPEGITLKKIMSNFFTPITLFPKENHSHSLLKGPCTIGILNKNW